jgi:tRNA A37 threonylcarbamoyladenosine synthetase subunit TsaC/SUA5/YrdC
LHQGVGSLAMRIPRNDKLQALLEKTGPLLTSSANPPGDPPATTITAAKEYFGDSVDFYLDGGDLTGHQASTIIRVVDDAVEIFRPGAIAITDAGEIVEK